MITDEMVEKALEVYWRRDLGMAGHPDFMREALEAVAPALIAQGMREAAEDFFAAMLKQDETRSTYLRIIANAKRLESASDWMTTGMGAAP